MLKQGTWYVPTLAAYYKDWDPPDTPSGQRDRKRVAVHGVSIAKALKAGVKIAFGTDVGGVPWSEPIARKYAREVEFGMTPMQAIQSATVKAAELLGMQGQIGVIAPGAFADLMAVRGDPSIDVSELTDVAFVIKDGRVFGQPTGEGR
jgi:imidazolonepropionase-like amidohydrolase